MEVSGACTPRLLEGLFEAVVRLLSDRALPRDLGGGAALLPQVNRRTGHRLKHKLVDSVTGEAVDSLNKARGYEVG